jgi:hypothetical protein
MSYPTPWTFAERHPAVKPADLIALFEAVGYHRAARPAHVAYRPGLEHIVRLVRDAQNYVLVSHHNLAVVLVGPHANSVIEQAAIVVGGPR